jgi:hypothetical protein
MPRRPAHITQADVARIIQAARAVRVETEHYPNHYDALAAELEGARNEKPECNVAGRVAA